MGGDPTDIAGAPRVFAPGTSCASIDIGAYQFEPSGPPTVVTGAATGVTQTAAALGGTANGGGGAKSAYFQFGPGAPGGGPPSTFTSTTTQCVAPAGSASSVPASISGLTPATVYDYRLVATNAQGTTTPAATQTLARRRQPPTPPGSPVSPTVPAVTRLSESGKTWRDGEISFTLNERATVTLSLTHQVAGRKLHRRCMAPSAKNHRRPRCTRTLTDSFSLTATSGTNTIRISRVRELGVGRYKMVVSAKGEHAAPASLSFTIAK